MAMNWYGQTKTVLFRKYGLPLLLTALFLGGAAIISRDATGGPFGGSCGRRPYYGELPECPARDCDVCNDIAGSWYWLRSPDEEKRAVAALYNRYCIRCHGVDGRGVWDIPDVPNFASARWQACRSDSQLARIIVEGRGAIMPPFRGTLSLEEACAVGRYLRTFVPSKAISRPAPETIDTPVVPPPPQAKDPGHASNSRRYSTRESLSR